jgi:hypothetical protein
MIRASVHDIKSPNQISLIARLNPLSNLISGNLLNSA